MNNNLKGPSKKLNPQPKNTFKVQNCKALIKKNYKQINKQEKPVTIRGRKSWAEVLEVVERAAHLELRPAERLVSVGLDED